MQLNKELRNRLFPVHNSKWGNKEYIMVTDLSELKEVYNYIEYLESLNVIYPNTQENILIKEDSKLFPFIEDCDEL